jgi:hypothetical protein
MTFIPLWVKRGFVPDSHNLITAAHLQMEADSDRERSSAVVQVH